jgi:uncharacterized protein (DUF2062 family)
VNDLVAILISGVVGAAIASIIAYRFALRQARLDRDRRRRAVASAILF